MQGGVARWEFDILPSRSFQTRYRKVVMVLYSGSYYLSQSLIYSGLNLLSRVSFISEHSLTPFVAAHK